MHIRLHKQRVVSPVVQITMQMLSYLFFLFFSFRCFFLCLSVRLLLFSGALFVVLFANTLVAFNVRNFVF